MTNPDDEKHEAMLEEAKAQLSGMAKQGLSHPSTKPVLTGAAIGGVAAILLPVLTLPVGIVAGAGIAFYNRIKR